MGLAIPMQVLATHLRPSGAATWLLCGGSVAMRAAFPEAPEDGDSDVTEDGTACHWLASEIWDARYPDEGTLSPNQRVLTDEMFEAVDIYHDVLRAAEWSAGETYCERPVDCSFIYPNMSGTPDAWTYVPGKLRIVDLKFGFRFVEVWENVQLTIYAVAVAKKLMLPPHTVIELVIVQPRSFHRDGPVRTWRTTLEKLEPMIERLRVAAAHAMGPNAMCVPNPGCLDCAGRHACEALHNSAWGATEVAYSSTPHLLNAEQLARELTVLDEAERKIKARKSGLMVQAEAAAREGKILPGWELSTTFAREGWLPGTEATVMTLAKEYFKINAAKPMRAMTPNQVRKLGVPSTIVSMFAHRPSTGVKLMKADPNAARKAFEQHPIDREETNGN